MRYANGSYKTVQDTAGYQAGCAHFDPCPLCYGCRNYGIYPFTCDELCAVNPKTNICNRSLHHPGNIARMVRRDLVTIKEENNA